MPLGVRLAVFGHPAIGASLYWSLPAATILLLGAIGQPVRGMRVALVVAGTVFLLMALRRSWPQLQRAIGTVRRMRNGTLVMGRIASCRFAWKGKRSMKPFAAFMKEWNARDSDTAFDQGIGCLFGFFALAFAIPTVIFFVIFAFAAIFSVVKIPGVQVSGDVSFSFFARTVGMTAITVVMFVVARAIMRLYLRYEFEQALNEQRDPADQVSAADALQREIQAMISGRPPKPEKENPLPPENAAPELACMVEFPTPSGVRIAESTAVFGPHFNRNGLDVVLFQAGAPAQVDMLQAFPRAIMLAGGQWQPLPVFGPFLRLACVAAPLMAALGALAVEGVALSLG